MPRPSRRRGTLLLVEDEDLLRDLVARFLAMSEYEVVAARDGREAIEQIDEAGPFDLALVDLNLPDLSGVEVCRHLRRRWPGHPVMICSAAVLPEHEATLRGLGIDHVLTKPYSPEILLEQIGDRLRRSA